MVVRITAGVCMLMCISCSPPPAPQAIADQFGQEPALFDACRKAAYHDPALTLSIGEYVQEAKLSAPLLGQAHQFRTGDLVFARLHTPSCEAKEYDMELVFEGDRHLEYKVCGDVGVSKSMHSEDGSIEYWGLDDHWFAWINHASGNKK